MLEDKQAWDTERTRQEAEREQLQNEIARLRQALEQEKKRGSSPGCSVAERASETDYKIAT